MAKDYFAHPKALIETDHIGRNTRVWAFAHILKGARIGENCNIGDNCFIESDVVIGNNVTIKNGISIWDGVRIEDDVFLGPNMVFTNVLLPRSGVRENFQETIVKKGATIGANATILCGITIGEYSMIGAGSVVTKGVAPYSLVYGNPARAGGHVCKCGNKLEPDKDLLKCVCGKSYKLINNNIKPVNES